MREKGLADQRPLVRAKRHDSCFITRRTPEENLELSKAISSFLGRVPRRESPRFCPLRDGDVVMRFGCS